MPIHHNTNQGLDPTHYEILNLCNPAAADPQTIKKAYRQTLLLYHPDKLRVQDGDENIRPNTTVDDQSRRYTITQIQLAYTTLIDPLRRREYDKSLLLRRFGDGKGKNWVSGLDGGETVDLDDFQYHVSLLGNGEEGNGCEKEQTAMWTRQCRCGDPLGFVITEHDLEREMRMVVDMDNGFEKEHREILVGCRGCSITIRVAFAVSE